MRIIIRVNLLHAVILRRVIHQNQLTPLKLPFNRLHHCIEKWSNLLLTVLHIGNDGNKFRFCHNTFYFLVIGCRSKLCRYPFNFDYHYVMKIMR